MENPLASPETASVRPNRLTDAVRLLAKKLRDQSAGADLETVERGRYEGAAYLLDAAVRALSGEADDVDPEAVRAMRSVLRAIGGVEEPEDPLEGLRGHSRAITVPELLSFVSSSYKTGLLRVQTTEESFLIQLDDGFIVHAQSDAAPEHELLGYVLVNKGVITAEQLERVLEREDSKKQFLGQALLAEGLLSKESLTSVLTYQIQRLFMRLCAAEHAAFWFYEGTSLQATPDVRLNVTHLLLETARQKDEADHRGGLEESVLAALDRAENGESTPPAEAEDEPAEEEPPRAPAAAEHGEPAERFRATLRRRIEEGQLDLPLLPDSAGRLLSMCWGERVDAEALQEHIGQDQALCAHVLRIANSAAYAPAVPIVSLKLGLTRLGTNALRQIALAVTVSQRTFASPGWEEEVQRMWKSALITCEYAKAIARRSGQREVQAGLFGLLQDVGKPAVLHALIALQDEVHAELEPYVARVLVEEFHPEVGAMLAKEWSMPAWLESVIRFHHAHSFLTADDGEDTRRHALIADLAERLSQWALSLEDGEAERLIQLDAWKELGIEPQGVRELLDEVSRIRRLAESVF